MLTKTFLSPTEIEERIAQESASDKERKLTPEQIEAIYSNGSNILVSASAGSGKTFVMVERILDMIGRGVGIDQLFISTFTVKAAGELKERLEKRLTEQLGQVETDEERAFLSDQIAKIGTADIGTMDADVYKRQAYESHLSINEQLEDIMERYPQSKLSFKNDKFCLLYTSRCV